MIVHPTEQQQRVIGQLVLALRESGLHAGARDIDYTLDEHGVIVVDWVEGASADEVAAGLAAYSAAGLLDVNAVAPITVPNTLRADILVSGLPVRLMAFEPVGLERARRVSRVKRRAPESGWPSPLREIGAARDTVLWTLDREHGTVATVVRLPHDLSDDTWFESGILVVLPEEDVPAGVWLSSRIDVDRAREKCSLLLRIAPKGWTVAEADDWMADELNSKHAPRLATAVAWPDRCVVRRWSGLRMEATGDNSHHRAPWSHVPSALLSSLWHPKPCRRQPPKTMKVREFADTYSVTTISVASTWCAPSWQYVSSPLRG
jgi:hypothetical protein